MAKIALDIDSTLHPYWDLLQRIVSERYGIELPYEEQRDWGITALERDAVVHCVEETHSDENIAAGGALPGRRRDGAGLARARPLDPRDEPPAREHVRGDRAAGSTRSACPSTISTALRQGAALRGAGCRRAVDDSPVNIAKARDAGIVPATILHPWNEEVVERERRGRRARLEGPAREARSGPGADRDLVMRGSG